MTGPRHEVAEPERRSRLGARSWNVLTVLLVLLVVVLLKNLVIETFVIPSGSMEDTLSEGDRVAVTLYDAHNIERGDVVVFVDPGGWLGDDAEASGWRGVVQSVLVTLRLLPQDAGHHLIKRVIGLPGDHVVSDGQGTITVNGVALDETYVKAGRSASEIAFDVTVPADCLWVMGDNRSNSEDSRYHRDDAHGGCVPLDDVVGVARAVVWPVTRWTGLGSGESVFTGVPEPSAPATGATATGATARPAPTTAATRG